VFNAIKNIDAEVFVVDNNSVDDSMEMVAQKYPEAISICNKKNVGFSVANNQAIKQSRGEYVLLLNPDTVVEENTFEKTVAFMDEHPDAGALGVKMIDGRGNFLPESKRGIPTPWVSFCKMTGLTKFFPKSKLFARYYLGHLSENETNEVEILAGAFMLMRKSALDKSGLLDETFFMYGEDIDLSYRIIKAGYKNYYFADTQIIHYKGESTKKGSLNYVYIFYKAMVIFAKKHFSQNNAQLFSFFINAAIYLRAFVAIFQRFIKAAIVPLLDIGILYGGLYYIKEYWEHNHRFIRGGEYQPDLVQIAFPSYIALWLVMVYLANGYTKPTKAKNIIYGVFIGTVAILALYGLLPEEYRFSRAIILLGAGWALIILPLYRFVLQRLFKINFFSDESLNKRVLLVGEKEETERVLSIITTTGARPGFTDIVTPQELNNLESIKEKIEVFKIDELIFCSENLSSARIIEYMGKLKGLNIEIKIAPPESLFVIGSNSIHTQGDIYSIKVNKIAQPHEKRNKRLFDLVVSFLGLVLFPILIPFQKKPSGYLMNCLAVLFGRKTWVGYAENTSREKLPQLKPGVLNPSTPHQERNLDNVQKAQLDFLYARDYNVKIDADILLKSVRMLGNS
jgi:GT2 family glycosyltransferase